MKKISYQAENQQSWHRRQRCLGFRCRGVYRSHSHWLAVMGQSNICVSGLPIFIVKNILSIMAWNIRRVVFGMLWKYAHDMDMYRYISKWTLLTKFECLSFYIPMKIMNTYMLLTFRYDQCNCVVPVCGRGTGDQTSPSDPATRASACWLSSRCHPVTNHPECPSVQMSSICLCWNSTTNTENWG